MTLLVLVLAGALVAVSACAVGAAGRALGGRTGRRTPARALAFSAAVSVFACSLVLVRYTPRFAVFRAFAVPPAMRVAPEVNRATDALRQYEDLGARIETPTNRVIRWRLLPPLVGRALALPPAGYLALAPLACLLVAGLAAWIVLRDTGDRRAAVLAALLVASGPWFFVATGWLAYFDSWCVLALLVASFVPSRAALALACLLAPWADERFTLTLPLVLAVRWVHGREVRRAPPGTALRDALVAAAASAPYLLVRAVAYRGRDVESRDFVETIIAWSRVAAVPRERWVHAAWHGLRGLWPFLLALPLAVEERPLRDRPRRSPRALVLALTLAVLAGYAFLVFDVSRAMSMALPAALLGVVAALRAAPRAARLALLAACAVNLTSPTRHVVTSFEMPIASLPVELERWRSPPVWLTPGFHVARARVFHEQGRLADARESVAAALALESGFGPALELRAEIGSATTSSDRR